MLKKVIPILIIMLLIGSFVNAAAIKKNTTTTPGTRSTEISFLTKHTSFTKDEISDFYKQGLKKDDIKCIYILKGLTTEDLDTIITIYKGNDKIEMVMKDLQIDPDEYKEQYERAYPNDEESSFDRAERIRHPLKQKK